MKPLFSTTTVGRGQLAFAWFNDYSGVVMKTSSGYLVVDPFGVGAIYLPAPQSILLTHEHPDHFDIELVRELWLAAYKRWRQEYAIDEEEVLPLLQRGTTRLPSIVADPTTYQELEEELSIHLQRRRRSSEEFLEEEHPYLKRVEPGDTVDIDVATVHVFDSNHPPAATPVTYLIITEDGVTVYHTSDSLPFEGMRDIGQRFDVDICFCPVGIAPGVTPETGAKIARLVRPKVAVPYHGPLAAREKFAKIVSRYKIKALVPGKCRVYAFG